MTIIIEKKLHCKLSPKQYTRIIFMDTQQNQIIIDRLLLETKKW